MSRALVLSGGGSLGAFQAGVLLSILRGNGDAEYDVYCGNSAGAINAAFLSQYKKFANGVFALNSLWENLLRKDIYRINPVQPLISTGLVNNNPLYDMLGKHIDAKKIQESGKVLHIGVSEMTHGEYVEVPQHTPQLDKWVGASAAFPVFFPCVRKEDKLFTDGALLCHAPLKAAIKEGATHIDVVLTSTYRTPYMAPERIKNPLQAAGRYLSMILNSLWKEDLRKCHKCNERAKRGEEKYKPIEVNIYAPQEPLDYKSHVFKTPDIREMIQIGSETRSVPLAEFLKG